jgi:hypothetical protein
MGSRRRPEQHPCRRQSEASTEGMMESTGTPALYSLRHVLATLTQFVNVIVLQRHNFLQEATPQSTR